MTADPGSRYINSIKSKIAVAKDFELQNVADGVHVRIHFRLKEWSHIWTLTDGIHHVGYACSNEAG